MRQTMVMDSSRTGELIIWPNGDILLTHDEIDAVIEAFQKLKKEHSPEEIERYNIQAPIDAENERAEAQKQKSVEAKHWRKMRKKVLDRDGKQCVECGASKHLHIHHLTYENKGAELMEDLVTLCRPCHNKK